MLRPLAAASVLLLASCTVPTVDLSGKACDSDHPCVLGYACVAGRCVDGAAQVDAGSGTADAGTGCTLDQQRACGSEEGECSAGTQTCGAGGVWGACTGGVGPKDETCNGRDDDCDGSTDEADEVEKTASPCELQAGVCAGARKGCDEGAEVACEGLDYGVDYEAGVETTCDGLDNDCDGQTDEGMDDDRDGWGVDASCPRGKGDCDDWNELIHPNASETCNGRDDDCDDKADESWACVQGAAGAACDSGCNGTGVKVCGATCGSETCQKLPEVCNGKDDDCSGSTDEGLTGSATRLFQGDGTPFTLVGVPGVGFSAAYARGGVLEVAVLLLPGAPVKLGPVTRLAASPAHLVWATPAGAWAKRLQRGTPAGSDLEVFKSTRGVGSLAALGRAETGASLLVASDGGDTVVTAKVDGYGRVSKQTRQDPAVGDVAVARVDDAVTLVVWEGLTGLRAATTNDLALATPFDLVDAAAVKAASGPVGAGHAVAFLGEATVGNVGVHLAHASGVTVGTGKDLALVSDSSSGLKPSQVSLAALGSNQYLVAWVATNTTTSQRSVQTVRIAYDSATGWGKPSAPTGFIHPSDATAAILGAVVASDERQFQVLFHTRGTAGDELWLRLTCPSG